jgi:hypothetical protein
MNMEPWVTATLVLSFAWTVIACTQFYVFDMKFDVASVFDALAITYVLIGLPTAVFHSWLVSEAPNMILVTIILIFDFFLTSFIVTGKWLFGTWIGHGEDPNYFGKNTYLPLLLVWFVSVAVAAPFYTAADVETYLDFFYVFVFGMASVKGIMNILSIATK